MNNLQKSLNLLRKIITETPREVLERHFAKEEDIKYEGPTVEEYFANFAENHNSIITNHHKTP